MTQQPPDDKRPVWEGGAHFPPPSNLRQPQYPQQEPVFNTQYPPQQYPSPGQFVNQQYPSGQYPPVLQQVPPQGYQQQQSQGYPQQQNYQQFSQQMPQGYPQQPSILQSPTPTKKKAWYKKPWGIVLIVFLSLGACGGISNAFSTTNSNTSNTTASSMNITQDATTAPTQVIKPTPKPTQKPKPTPTQKPTLSPSQIEASYKTTTTDITVSNIDKQGDDYKGRNIHFTAKILNFVKDDSGKTAGANLDDLNYASTSVIQIAFPDGVDLSRLNQGDIVEVWGTDGGTVSGTNGFGATIQEVVVVSLYLTDQTTGYQS